MTRPDRYVVVGAVIDRELRRRLVAGLAVGLVLGLTLGFVIARSTSATSRSASEKPLDLASVPAPAFGDARPVGDVQGQSEAPQPSLTVGSAGVNTDAESGGVSPSPEPVAVRTPAASTPGSQLAVSLTWYCNATHPEVRRSRCRVGYPDRPGVADLFAATSKGLARAGWRIGRDVTVCVPGPRCVTARVVDECGSCPGMAVDLYADAYAELARLGSGRLAAVVVR